MQKGKSEKNGESRESEGAQSGFSLTWKLV